MFFFLFFLFSFFFGGGFYNSFAQNWRKPLRSRLSPAANDVNPVHTVFVNLSLLVKETLFGLKSDVAHLKRMSRFSARAQRRPRFSGTP